MQKLGDIKVTITSNVITLLTCNPILTPPKYQKRFCILNYIKSHSHDKEMCLHYLSIIQTGISYLASQTVMSASRWKLHSSSLQSCQLADGSYFWKYSSLIEYPLFQQCCWLFNLINFVKNFNVWYLVEGSFPHTRHLSWCSNKKKAKTDTENEAKAYSTSFVNNFL